MFDLAHTNSQILQLFVSNSLRLASNVLESRVTLSDFDGQRLQLAATQIREMFLNSRLSDNPFELGEAPDGFLGFCVEMTTLLANHSAGEELFTSP